VRPILISRILTAPTLALTLLATFTIGVETQQELVRIGNASINATLAAIGDNSFSFTSETGGDIQVPFNQIVRWGYPASSRDDAELDLIDGSRISLAASWSNRPAVLLVDGALEVDTAGFGRMRIAKSMVRAIQWQLPRDATLRIKRIDRALQIADQVDHVVALNGEHLSGRVLAIKEKEDSSAENGSVLLEFEGDLGRVSLPQNRVQCVTFSKDPDNAILPSAPVWIGLRDGSLLATQTVGVEGDMLTATTACGVEFQSSFAAEVVFLQGDGSNVAYLSAMEPLDYLHQPYLELPWSYRDDRNADGGALSVARRRYLRGLGMHSASRLTYTVPRGAIRFAAAAAVDDRAEDGGSVRFRVYTRASGNWDEAYASPIVRGGDPPTPVSAPVAGAEQIALVVDYADCGDERDDADWLDARFELESAPPRAPSSRSPP